MIIDTRIIPEGRSERRAEVRRDDFKELADGLPAFDAPVVCEATIDRMGDTIAVLVRFDGTFGVECARCLAAFSLRAGGEFRVILKEDDGRGSAYEDDDDGTYFYFDAVNSAVDISPALYDEIMISLPIKPLCKEDCAGVVVEDDGGDNDAVDPRWEALKSLKNKQ